MKQSKALSGDLKSEHKKTTNKNTMCSTADLDSQAPTVKSQTSFRYPLLESLETVKTHPSHSISYKTASTHSDKSSHGNLGWPREQLVCKRTAKTGIDRRLAGAHELL